MKSISYREVRGLSDSGGFFTVKQNFEFQRAYKKGLKKGTRFFAAYVYENRMGVNRIGITVGKRFGNSVQRNRFKRLVRESYREFSSDMKKGYDIIIAARPSERTSVSPNMKLKAKTLPEYAEIRADMKKAFSALGLFEQ